MDEYVYLRLQRVQNLVSWYVMCPLQWPTPLSKIILLPQSPDAVYEAEPVTN